MTSRQTQARTIRTLGVLLTGVLLNKRANGRKQFRLPSTGFILIKSLILVHTGLLPGAHLNTNPQKKARLGFLRMAIVFKPYR